MLQNTTKTEKINILKIFFRPIKSSSLLYIVISEKCHQKNMKKRDGIFLFETT